MVLKKPPLFVVNLALLLLLITGFYSLVSRHDNKQMISALISVGVENTYHVDFVKKIIKNTSFEPNAKVIVFLGPYEKLTGMDGFLLRDDADCYIFIDWWFYFSLEQGEREALIAHELGHVVYQPNLVEQLELDTVNWLRRYFYFRKLLYSQNSYFRNRHEQITTKYQVKADYFAAKKTSPEKVTFLLNKLFVDKDSNDYEMRIESLNKLKQEQIP